MPYVLLACGLSVPVAESDPGNAGLVHTRLTVPANACVGTQYIRRRNQLLRDNASRHEETAVREAYLHLRVQVLRSKFGPLHRHREGSLASSSHTSRRASMESLHLSPETSSPRLPRRQLSSSLSHGLVPTKSAEASRCANGKEQSGRGEAGR